MALEVEGNKALAARLHQRIDSHVSDVVEAHLVDDNQVHNLGKYIRCRQQLNAVGDDLPSPVKCKNCHQLRDKQHDDNLIWNASFFQEAVHHPGDTDGEVEHHKAYEHRMQRTVVFVHKPPHAVRDDEIARAVKPCPVADRKCRQIHKCAGYKHGNPAPLRHLDLTQVENGKRDNQNQKRSAEVGDLVRQNRFI